MHFGRPPFQNLIPPVAPTNSSDSDMQRKGFLLTTQQGRSQQQL